MALQMPAFISGLLPNGMTPTQQVNNPNPSGVFDPQTGNVLPPQLLGGRLNAANEMLREGSSGAPVGSWTQGMNRVLQGLVGGYEEKKYADQYMQGMQQGAQAGGNFLSSLMSGGAGSTPTAAPVAGTSSSAASPSSPSASLAQYGPLFSATEQKYNLPSGFLMQTAQIENGGNVNTKDSPTGAKGPFQFTSGTAKAYGLTDPYDINASTDAAARLAADNAKYLSAALGRAPTAGELYLAHQQGAQGAAQLLTHPDAPATDVADPHNLAVNGYKPGQTAGQFASMFTGRFGNTGTAAASPAGAPSASGPYPTVAQNMAQADATAGQPLPTSIPNAGPQAPSNQVASLDPSIVPQQSPQATNTNIPLPPIDPRNADPGSFNKGLGVTPGQQAVLSAASPSPAAPPGGPAAPPLTPGGQSVVAALPPPGGAPSAAPPLSQGGQQVAQAVMPPMPQQQYGLTPQQIQQYTQIMQNAYVPEATKAMVTQAVMSRISPHGVDNIDMGDHIEQVDKLTGQPLRSLPKAVPGVAVNADQNYLNPYTAQPMNGGPQTPAYHWMTPDEKRQAGIAEDAMIQVDRAGKAFTPGGQTINVGGPGDKYNEDIKTALSDTPAALIKGIPNEQQSLYAIHAMQGALQRIKQNGGTTGVGTEELTRLKSAINTGANALGIAPLADTDNIADQNVLAKYNRQLAGAMAKGVAGARVTNFEMMNFLKSNPGQDTDPQGGERLLGIAEQMHARNLAVGQQIEDYAGQTQARGQKIDPGQISQITRNYDEQHHITDPITGQDLVKNPILPAAPPVTKQQGANQPQQAFPQPGKPALGFLKDSPTPEMRMEFDKRYGPGAAAKALGEQ